MQKSKLSYLVILLFSVLIVGCQDDNNELDTEIASEFSEYTPSEMELTYEKYASEVDADTTLRRGNSLYYSREDGATMEVFIHVNAKEQPVKIEEIYANSGSVSLCSNVFYFKNGKKYISKELFEVGDEVSGHFTERVSYYNKKEVPLKTLVREAEFEDQLEFEQYSSIKEHDCSTERAWMVLNQEGDFATTFQGFISEEPYLYLIVGENKKTGYTSSLVVQYVDQTIQKLQSYEADMIGKGIQVEFETLNGSQGYEYQILLSTRLR